MKRIDSLQNPLVKHLVQLRKERSYRAERRAAVIEGIKMVGEVCGGVEAEHILATDRKLIPERAKAKVFFEVSNEVIAKISGAKSPEGILAEVPLPPESGMENITHLIALDGVSDPGNLGTLLRTALALGWEGAFLLDSCCDPFNDKALRAAKGATFRLPLSYGSWQKLEAIMTKNRLRPFAADTKGADVCDVESGRPILLVLGSESGGLSKNTALKCDKVTIPMAGQMESLNVAIAGGILMYLLRK